MFVTRFAPSPTGPLHLGHAYSACLAFDMAMAAGGTFLLRIEDIDRSRARATWEQQIYDDLGWLGLTWPAPVMRQSDRTSAYAVALQQLAEMGLTYPCRCRRADIEAAAGAPQEGVPQFGPDGRIYPGTCRHRLLSDRGPDDVIRLNMTKVAALLPSLAFTETGPIHPGTHRCDPTTLMSTIGDPILERRAMGGSYHLSVVVDEDATLVLAGAGSGKTSVITAKAAYLVKAEIRKPSELLLLAFAKDAATEMSERIEVRCGVPVAARTFHALAYEIIGEVEGEKPPLAPTATDDKAFLSLMKEILRHVVATASDIAQTVIGWFAGFFDDFPSEWDFKTKHEWYAQIESRNLRTLQGETVNSFEELLIANWLFRNGIAYEYEPNYEHKLQKTGRRVYTPDFRLTESGVYIEHFGVRKKRGRDGVEELTTAPCVDREEYLESMDWKRQVHAEHETVLVETYSWEREEGRLLDMLAEKLKPHVTLRSIPDIEIYDRVAEVGVVDSFTSLIGTFLRHFKNGGYRMELTH